MALTNKIKKYPLDDQHLIKQVVEDLQEVLNYKKSIVEDAFLIVLKGDYCNEIERVYDEKWKHLLYLMKVRCKDVAIR